MNHFVRKASIALAADSLTIGSLITVMPVHAAEQPRVVYVASGIVQLQVRPGKTSTSRSNGAVVQGDALTFIVTEETQYTSSVAPSASEIFGYSVSPSGIATVNGDSEVYYHVTDGTISGYINAKDCSDVPVEAPSVNYGVQLESGVSESARTELQNALSILPANCKAQLKGVTFNIGDSIFSSTENTGFTGLYYASSSTINLRTQYVSYAAIHECGHHFDVVLGRKCNMAALGKCWFSSTDEFVRIFHEEAAASGLGSHATENTREYFASAVKKYFEQPKALKKNAPQTYAFVSAAMQML